MSDCEHIKSDKLLELMSKYDITNVRKTTGDNYMFEIFGSSIEVSPSNFYKTICRYEELQEQMKAYQEKLIDTYIDKGKIWISIITKENKQYNTTISAYSKILNKRKEFEKKVENNGHKILSTYINAHSKVLIDFCCGHDATYMTPNNYLNGNRCPVCCNKAIVPYVNDCYTLRKDLLKYFVDINDSIGRSCCDREKILYQCPNCYNQRINTLANIKDFGFSCYCCGDGISYPEKMMKYILDDINEEYMMHKKFKWCTFEIDGESHYGIYDFVLKNKNIIIETDGAFHQNNNLMNGYTKEHSQNIDLMKDSLANKNGYIVIRIDCNYKNIDDRFNYIKEHIINKLQGVIELNNIDWNKIRQQIDSSIILEACKLWNEGKSSTEISKIIGVTSSTIVAYLKRGNEINMCSYSKSEALMRRKRKQK